VNYGLSLSIWDYLFGTAYVPNKENITIGYKGDSEVPKNFLRQLLFPFTKQKNRQKL